MRSSTPDVPSVSASRHAHSTYANTSMRMHADSAYTHAHAAIYIPSFSGSGPSFAYAELVALTNFCSAGEMSCVYRCLIMCEAFVAERGMRSRPASVWKSLPSTTCERAA